MERYPWMRRLWVLAALFVVLAGLAASARAQEEWRPVLNDLSKKLLESLPQGDGQPAIAVVPFDVPKDEQIFSNIIQDRLTNAIAAAGKGKVRVVSRQYKDKTLDELAEQSKRVTDEKTAAEIGKQVGAKFMITGSLVIGDTVRLNAKLINIETDVTLVGDEALFKLDEDLRREKMLAETGKLLAAMPTTDHFLTGTKGEEYVIAGDRLYRYGKDDRARDLYELALKEPDLDRALKARARVRLGYMAHMQGKYAEAERQYKAALEADPDNAFAQANLYVVAMQEKTVQAAKLRYGDEYGAKLGQLLEVWIGQQRKVEALSEGMMFCMELSKLVQDANGQVSAVPVAQGGTLYSARSKFKVVFRASKPVYVYVWNMDSTGKVWPVWPMKDRPVGAVLPNRAYDVPAGDDWFFLDDNTGVEFFFYMVSIRPIPELAGALDYFGAHLNPDQVKAVELPKPTQLALATRGIGGKLGQQEMGLDTDKGKVGFKAEEYAITGSEAAGVIWFKHEKP